MSTHLFFQPEYVSKFKCDASKCNAGRCCKGWDIFIDADTYEKYSRLAPHIAEHIHYNEGKNQYTIDRNERGVCPFLTEKNLCDIQLKYGENFLSLVCMSYPRHTYNFGKFLERSMTLTCPVAAEMILFGSEPLKFELVQISGEKIPCAKLEVPEKFLPHIADIQIAEISILQERTLTIDQRLIVLGFFLDKLEEISADAIDENALRKLIAAYESKKFLAEQVPNMVACVKFDAKNFVGLTLNIFEMIYGNMSSHDGRKFFDAVAETLEIKPDENNFVSATAVATRYENLAAERKNFSARYSTFLENYLVNELFMNCYPWQFPEGIMKNYVMFVATYKIFELLTFAATGNGLGGKDDLLKLVDRFTTQTNHNGKIYQQIFEHVKKIDDPFALLEP